MPYKQGRVYIQNQELILEREGEVWGITGRDAGQDTNYSAGTLYLESRRLIY